MKTFENGLKSTKESLPEYLQTADDLFQNQPDVSLFPGIRPRTRRQVQIATESENKSQNIEKNAEALGSIIDSLIADVRKRLTPDDLFLALLDLDDPKKSDALSTEQVKMIDYFFEHTDPRLDCSTIQNEMKKFGKGSAIALQLPLFDILMRGFINSSVDVERLFSVMNLIMAKRRVSMGEERRRCLMNMMFNRRLFGDVNLNKFVDNFVKECDARMKRFALFE